MVLVDIDRDGLADVEAAVQSGSGGSGSGGLSVCTRALDVSDERAVEALWASLRGEGRPPGPAPSVVVASAGTVPGRWMAPLPGRRLLEPRHFRRTLDVNLCGSAWVARELLRHIPDPGDGAVVLVASLMGHLGSAGLSDYCSSKWALLGLAESLRLELRYATRMRVGVTAVCPWLVDTGLFAGAFAGEASGPWHRRCIAAIRSWVLPPLAADAVAARIFDSLVDPPRRDFRLLPPLMFVPGFLVWLPVLLRLLPYWLQDILLDAAGGCKGMDSFRGREQHDVS